MKNKLLLLLAAFFAVLFAVPAFAQDVASVATPEPDIITLITQFATSFIQSYALKFPIIFTVVSAIGALRLLIKPTLTYLRSRADETPDPSDNARLQAYESSWWFKALSFGLDLAASIKLKK